MKKKAKTLGIILILVSLIAFGIFMWWGTTIYDKNYGWGIFVGAMGIFVCGLITFFYQEGNEQ